MVLMDHPRKFLEGVTLRAISLAMISQYLLFSRITPNQINVILIPNNRTFTPEIHWRSYLFHFPIGLDT